MNFRTFLLTLLIGMGLSPLAWAYDEPTAVNSVYQIKTASHLFWFAEQVNDGNTTAKAVLCQDIDLANASWTPIGTSSYLYKGTFDGQGHKISDFNLTVSGDGSGLFGYTSAANITNFSISGSITTPDKKKVAKVASIIGQASSTKISDINSSVNITVNHKEDLKIGGIVGEGSSCTISRCIYSGTISSTVSCQAFSGIISTVSGNTTIEDCLFDGTITTDKCNGTNVGVSSFIAYQSGGTSTIKNCLTVGTLFCPRAIDTYTKNTGVVVGQLKDNSITNNLENVYYQINSNSTPNLPLYGNVGTTINGKETVTEASAVNLSNGTIQNALNNGRSEVIWIQKDGSAYPTPEKCTSHVWVDGVCKQCSYRCQHENQIEETNCTVCGKMVDRDPSYTYIENEAQLLAFAQAVNAAGGAEMKARLTADIALTTTYNSYNTPIGTSYTNCFTGEFDGRGHSITGLDMTSAAYQYFGFFGVVYKAKIHDLLISGQLSNTYTEKYSCSGFVGFVGHNDGGDSETKETETVIDNIKSSINLTASGELARMAGIVAFKTNTSYKMTINNCRYSGTIRYTGTAAPDALAGILGISHNYDKIENCLFDGKIVATGITATPDKTGSIGGIVAYMYKPSDTGACISNCVSCGTYELNGYIAHNNGAIVGIVKNTAKTDDNVYIPDASNPNVFNTATNPDNTQQNTFSSDSFEEDQFQQSASGQLCAKLNSLGGNWSQIIGQDKYPVQGTDYPVTKDAEGNYTIAKCALTDKQNIAFPDDATSIVCSDFTYSRAASGMKGIISVCLPIALDNSLMPTATAKAMLYKSDNVENGVGTVNFEYCDNNVVPAGKACFIDLGLAVDETPASDWSISLTNVQLSPTVSSGTSAGIYGTFVKINPLGTGFFKVNSNGTKLVRSTATSTVVPFRAYLRLSDATSAASEFRMAVTEGNETGISSLEESAQQTELRYDLQGRRIVGTKGLMICNGKVILKK